MPSRSAILPTTLLLGALAGCAGESPTEQSPVPLFVISDAVHSEGTPGFFFLPPMVQAPSPAGTFDANLAGLDPQVVICDLDSGAASDCGGNSPAAAFSTTTTPAVTLDASGEQYRVNWDTGTGAFQAGKTYRVHIVAGTGAGRRALGFADVLLTASPGQAKNVATGDLIALQDGRTLPIKFRIEGGIPGSIGVAVTPGAIHVGETANATATVLDLHAQPLNGKVVSWSYSGVGVSFAPASGATGGAGQSTTSVLAGAMTGASDIQATTEGLTGSATLTVVSLDVCLPASAGATISTPLPGTGPFYVTNQDANSVGSFANGADGDAAPLLSIQGPATGLSAPRGIGRDGSGNLYVANSGANRITVYGPGASGNAVPIRSIAGAATQLAGLEGLAVDGAGSVYVADQVNSRIMVFAPGANGNVPPSRVLAGSCTGLSRPMGLAFDASGRLHVANLASYNNPGTQKVTVYAAGASGNASPLATIQGGLSGLFNPLGISVDAAGDIYVANYGNTDLGPINSGTAIRVYSAGANGNVAPSRSILGDQSEPTGMAVDGSGKLFVANFFSNTIAIFAAGANGSVSALAVISGGNPGLNRPSYVTF